MVVKCFESHTMRTLILLSFLALSGCMYNGNFDHPLDCAMGLTLWPGYCPRPGTAGYEREQASRPRQVLWNAPEGQTSTGFAKDKYACMQEARSNVSGGSVTGGVRLSTGVVLPGNGSSFSREVVSQPMFAACMEARGYQQSQ
jgi:hypothetical protein